MIIVDRRGLAAVSFAVATLSTALPTIASPNHFRGTHPAAHPRLHYRPARRFTSEQTPPVVYGASAPYYVFGHGGGDEYGDDPIGGPSHVGDDGPAVGFGSNFRSLTDAEARRAAGWPS